MEKTQDGCPEVSFKSSLLCKIGMKSHVLVPVQSKSDAHGRQGENALKSVRNYVKARSTFKVTTIICW